MKTSNIVWLFHSNIQYYISKGDKSNFTPLPVTLDHLWISLPFPINPSLYWRALYGEIARHVECLLSYHSLQDRDYSPRTLQYFTSFTDFFQGAGMILTYHGEALHVEKAGVLFHFSWWWMVIFRDKILCFLMINHDIWLTIQVGQEDGLNFVPAFTCRIVGFPIPRKAAKS